MKYLISLCAAFALTACSIQGMVEKTVPEDVRSDHMAHIDKLLAKDMSRIERAFDLDVSDPETQKNINMILENIPDGKEIRRDYVGVNSAASVSVGEGKSRDINIVSEIQTEGGYMTVTGQYALGADGECCVMTNINVAKFDTSPVRQSLETVKKIAKIVGLTFLLLIAGLVFFLVRRRRKKVEA